MTVWLVATFTLLILLIPAAIASMRGEMLDRVIGMQLFGLISTLSLITIGIWAGRSVYMDVAIIFALLSFCGGLVYVQFLERWL